MYGSSPGSKCFNPTIPGGTAGNWVKQLGRGVMEKRANLRARLLPENESGIRKGTLDGAICAHGKLAPDE
ncbi:hypothetical protein HYFRA_00001581 [Hymenoscyphus fraxineus]|uniref:Uncharacterized protein n=1 Tax=Hymenoscyphus fraxineus TaxID=746836 RepID=A0A9N9PTZ0_9HELO|nr:hypothetical protein HYFRA_00001581 [Hymenoscyphus fraxineus]